MRPGGSKVYGTKIIIDIEIINFYNLIREIISNAKENNLDINIKWTYPTGIYNATSIEIKGDYKDRTSFISKLEKQYKIKDRKDLNE
ncbi:MAG: hypothetical protein P1P85_03090 [Patescibacteria group bacterium]|nr:hypothetical protein [Patescibacteria group bacterium]